MSPETYAKTHKLPHKRMKVALDSVAWEGGFREKYTRGGCYGAGG